MQNADVCEHTHKIFLNTYNFYLAHDVTTLMFHWQIRSRQLSHFNVGFKSPFLLKFGGKVPLSVVSDVTSFPLSLRSG